MQFHRLTFLLNNHQKCLSIFQMQGLVSKDSCYWKAPNQIMSLYWKQMKKKEDLWGSGSYIIILKHKLRTSDRDTREEQLPWLWLERNCDQKYLFDRVALLVSQTMIEKSLRIQTGLNLNKFFCTAGSWKTLEFSFPAGQAGVGFDEEAEYSF